MNEYPIHRRRPGVSRGKIFFSPRTILYTVLGAVPLCVSGRSAPVPRLSTERDLTRYYVMSMGVCAEGGGLRRTPRRICRMRPARAGRGPLAAVAVGSFA